MAIKDNAVVAVQTEMGIDRRVHEEVTDVRLYEGALFITCEPEGQTITTTYAAGTWLHCTAVTFDEDED